MAKDEHALFLSHWLHKKVTTPSGEEGVVSGYTEELEQVIYQVRFQRDGKTSWEAHPKEDLRKVKGDKD